MKYYLFTFFILFSFPDSLFAQSKESRFQQVESAKIAFISKQLELTPTEAQKFFPIYNEYRKEMRQLIRKKKANRSNFNRAQANELEFDTEVLNCKKKYRARFATVIPTSKASRFFEVEREFREKLFKELENRNKHRH